MTILQWFMAATLLLPIGVARAATSSAVNVPITITASTGSDEEFVGPFASWMDATKTAANGGCTNNTSAGADNTGTKDATTAIQNCINSLSSAKPVIYFPCGTYNISSTLNLSNQQNISLIGQDNSTSPGRCATTLRWTGSNGGKLLYIDGIYASQLTRLTFDGNNLANILVDQSWDGSTGPFDGSNQYIDDVFKNGNDNITSYGFRCGALGGGCSEVNLVRDTFSNLGFGVATCNANAVDVMVWYSSFSNMKAAVTNDTTDFIGGTCGSGEYHVIGSVFQGSTGYDIYNFGGAGINVLDSYSSGASQFANVRGNNTFQRNTIINTALGGSYTNGSVFYNGDVVFLDNTIENSNTTSSYLGGFGHIVSIGNRFTNSSPFNAQQGTLYESGDQTIPNSTINPPTLPETPPNNGRTVYEASPSGSGTSCTSGSPCSVQTAVCKASNGSSSTFSSGACTGTRDGLKNVAHLAAGTYSISSSVVVPASSNAQIIGDGWDTILSSVVANPVIAINGPSQVSLRGFHVTGNNGNTANDGIHLTNADQSGSYVYLRGGRYGGSTASVVLSSLVNTLVNADDFQAPYNTGPSDVIQSGSSHFNHFLGTGNSISLSDAASAQLIGGWFEGSSLQNNISGTGSYTHSTAHLAFPVNTNSFTLNNFTGTFALLNTNINNPTCPYTGVAVAATGSGAGGLIIQGIDIFPNPSSSAISNSAGSTLQSFGNFYYAAVSGSSCISFSALPDSPSPFTSGDLATVASGLTYFRNTKPLVPNGNPSGTTGVELYDVFVDGFNNAVQVAH